MIGVREASTDGVYSSDPPDVRVESRSVFGSAHSSCRKTVLGPAASPLRSLDKARLRSHRIERGGDTDRLSAANLETVLLNVKLGNGRVDELEGGACKNC